MIVVGKESAEAESKTECTCFGTGAEVQVRLDFTWTAEKSSASLYSTNHLADHCCWGQYTCIMPADRLLGTLLRSLQVYTDQQDTPR